MTSIERMLHTRIGLDASTVGSSLVHRAVHRRMQQSRIANVEAYVARLADDVQELGELVEEVVIPETYFYREPEAFHALAQRVTTGLHALGSGALVRVLSAPCSTGEEPYSIAMSLLAAGVPPDVYAIDGVDLSINAVQRARTAVYRSGSFRGMPERWSGFFAARSSDGSIALDERVRSLVRITQGNLLDASFQPPRAEYEYIFCRNLLIYFDTGTQARVLASLSRLLAADGVLVVGAADTFAVRRAGFVPVSGAERSFLFQHRPAPAVHALDAIAPRVAALRDSPHVAQRVRPQRRVIATTKPRIVKRRNTPESVRTIAPAHAALLDEIARLAGAGRLADAVRLGETALTSANAGVDLLAIMGATYGAMNDAARAEACYRRALYLDPAHVEVLLHLALLMDTRGDAAAARRLRVRARRSLDGTAEGAP